MAASSRPAQKRIDPATVRPKAAPVPPKAKAKSGNRGKAAVRRASIGDWIGGARIRTLPLSISPVVLGTGAAYALDPNAGWHWVRALLALAVAVCLQIGVNYANDYSDGVRGTDQYRVGPSRLTGSGAARPRAVLTVALVFFGLAAVAGVILVVLTQYWWLLAVGAVCIVAAYFYTGGKRPYGYYGLGEVFVFLFFGIVATAGTTFTQVGTVNPESWLAGAAAGFFACAVLMVNNLRDIEQDRLAGKRTLAVLVGGRVGRILFAVFVALPYVALALFSVLYQLAPYVYFTLLGAIPVILITLTAKRPPEFITALKLTSLTALVFGVGLAAALVF